MEISEPHKAGEATELFPRRFGKTAFLQKFYNPRLQGYEEYVLFHSDTRPVVILPLDTGQKVIAIKQFRYAANQTLIELPGGNADTDESFEEAARRELEEETGYKTGEIIALTGNPIWYDPSTLTTPFHAYLATGCTKQREPKSATNEQIELLFVSIAEWLACIQRGEIVDAKTIVATFLALPHLER